MFGSKVFLLLLGLRRGLCTVIMSTSVIPDFKYLRIMISLDLQLAHTNSSSCFQNIIYFAVPEPRTLYYIRPVT